MRQIFEFTMFLAGATVLHLAVGYVAPSGTQAAAGAGGDAPVTLAAANAGLQDMIAKWDRPVEIVQQVAQPAQNAPEMAPALMPSPERSVLERPGLQRPLAGDAPALPDIDQTTAPKPKLAELRPKLRPADKPLAQAKPVQANFNSAGQYVYSNFRDYGAPQVQSSSSLWKIQLGVSYEF